MRTVSLIVESVPEGQRVHWQQVDDLFTVGERAYNMERAFNALFGHSRKDETLCHLWMKKPIPKGQPGEGMKGIAAMAKLKY